MAAVTSYSDLLTVITWSTCDTLGSHLSVGWNTVPPKSKEMDKVTINLIFLQVKSLQVKSFLTPKIAFLIAQSVQRLSKTP